MTANKLSKATNDPLFKKLKQLDFDIFNYKYRVLTLEKYIMNLEGGDEYILGILKEKLMENQTLLSINIAERENNKREAIKDHLNILEFKEKIEEQKTKFSTLPELSDERETLRNKILKNQKYLLQRSKRYAYYVHGILGDLGDTPVKLGVDIDTTYAKNEEMALMRGSINFAKSIKNGKGIRPHEIEQFNKEQKIIFETTEISKKDMLMELEELRKDRQNKNNERINVSIDTADI